VWCIFANYDNVFTVCVVCFHASPWLKVRVRLLIMNLVHFCEILHRSICSSYRMQARSILFHMIFVLNTKDGYIIRIFISFLFSNYILLHQTQVWIYPSLAPHCWYCSLLLIFDPINNFFKEILLVGLVPVHVCYHVLL
jgi:hypothetical protein